MPGLSIRRRAPRFAAAVLAAALVLTNTAQAESGPFSNLAGTWAGGGSILIGNGAKEPIRCRAEYSVPGSGVTARMQLRCASDSYKFELQGNVYLQSGRVMGDWSERTRGTAGRIEGTVKGGQIDVRVDGQTFVALMSLITRGDKQSISIRTPSGSDMSEANIMLTRRG